MAAGTRRWPPVMLTGLVCGICWLRAVRPGGRWCLRWMLRPGRGRRQRPHGAGGWYHHPSRQTGGRPVVAGWCYQKVSQLSFGRDSWTWPVHARRIGPLEDGAAATVAQVRQAAARLGRADGDVPLFVFDAGSSYDPAALAYGLAGKRGQVLVRLRKNRVFFVGPPPRGRHTLGAPARHGARFALMEPATWG